jgi:hypothetical protein
MNKKVFKYELIGALLVITFGSLLHFIYQWSNDYRPIALIAAVNESTWEHLKLGFWPLFFWSIYEYFIFGKKNTNFIISKAITFTVFCISVPAIFYSYTNILGDNYLPLDILTFIVSVFLGQLAGYKLLIKKYDFGLNAFGIFLITVLLASFLTFSFFPPKIFLFKDPVGGGFGIY